jgi:S1-C subfamily serine protease
VALADSSDLDVGDFVVAIGNPFGLGQTVTTGIVRALGRSGLGIEGYENFIQTDASINPGNSGGALVDLQGRLVGINTAIIAPAGGNVGIGFAIPVNMARASMAQILEHGEVKRGQLGIGIQELTPDLRKAFDFKNGQQGVLVTEVQAGSPADKAGLKAGDVIVAVDGKAVKSSGELRSHIGSYRVGEEVSVGILRDGSRKTFDVQLGESSQVTAANGSLHPLLAGVSFESNRNGPGVVVADIAPNASALYSGLRPGDIIVAANKRRIGDLKSFAAALKLNNNAILLQIMRDGRGLYLVIR